jgi:hypothetical protein
MCENYVIERKDRRDPLIPGIAFLLSWSLTMNGKDDGNTSTMVRVLLAIQRLYQFRIRR